MYFCTFLNMQVVGEYSQERKNYWTFIDIFLFVHVFFLCLLKVFVDTCRLWWLVNILNTTLTIVKK
jgi:hypothetical protein